MEIDLDNLVFNGLDEAEERNAWTTRIKKRRRLLPTTTAVMPARFDKKSTGKPVLFLYYFFSPSMAAARCASTVLGERFRRAATSLLLHPSSSTVRVTRMPFSFFRLSTLPVNVAENKKTRA